ncbi:MAG: rubrerythrin family protein [Parcubacteria group bacterium]|nr:rubrerythrin family protein [Parcubacteria group bacterium]|tara:strand:- start:4413 stop:5288 length:876 start_codon:yes stop_codon:yes gene_type:complete
MDKEIYKKILQAQKNEITEQIIYSKLAESTKDEKNKKILAHIAEDELSHYNFWKNYSKQEVSPSKLHIWWYLFMSKAFGLTFSIRLMEKVEKKAHIFYGEISKVIPEAITIAKKEDEHEQRLISLINETKLKYLGSIVLGLNDALVELTGALAGLTLALQNSRIIAITGLITGIAASMSMAASEYLSTKSEMNEGLGKHPLTAAVYTGLAYILVVIFLILPYLILSNLYLALGITIANGVIVIFVFNFYISVAQDLSFKKRFWEMAMISLSITAITFGIGYLVRIFFDLDL